MLPPTGLAAAVLMCAAAATAITRDDFPAGFVFGAGSSAYQIEGAVREDGRKPSIWDTYTHKGYSYDNSTADVTADQYHKYKGDVKLMHDMGLDAYRFSIAWPRLIPDGSGSVNPKGLEYYNNLINELISHGIQPHVTLYHFDLPQALQDKYNGLLDSQFIEDFTAYADICFKEFGDRVKHWVTVNEPNIEPLGGYDTGSLPPQRCSRPFGDNCFGGNSTTEPYLVAHHLLLAHASVVSLYKEKYQAKQGGQIGMTLLGWWFEPKTESPEDMAAANRMNDFHIGWMMHPLVYGDYPPVMRKNAGSRLPSFTVQESKRLRGSFDFVGFNHYLVIYVKDGSDVLQNEVRDYLMDAAVTWEFPFPVKQDVINRLAIVKKAYIGLMDGAMPSLPWGLQKMMEHIRLKYRNPPVMIHENGAADMAGSHGYDDEFRATYLQDYIEALYLSIRACLGTWDFQPTGCKSQPGLLWPKYSQSGCKSQPGFRSRPLEANNFSPMDRQGSEGGDFPMEVTQTPQWKIQTRGMESLPFPPDPLLSLPFQSGP